MLLSKNLLNLHQRSIQIVFEKVLVLMEQLVSSLKNFFCFYNLKLYIFVVSLIQIFSPIPIQAGIDISADLMLMCEF